jgi:hypothetical protein
MSIYDELIVYLKSNVNTHEIIIGLIILFVFLAIIGLFKSAGKQR